MGMETGAQSWHNTKMVNQFIGGIQVLRVTIPPAHAGEMAAIALWVAAVPRDKAVEAVQAAVPVGWRVELTNDHLTPQQMMLVKLRPGGVCEFSSSVK